MQIGDAIVTALDFVKGTFPGADYRLEEFESKDDGCFEVTVSFRTGQPDAIHRGNVVTSGFGERGRVMIGVDASRLYKVVEVNSDGSVKTVRMRSFTLF